MNLDMTPSQLRERWDQAAKAAAYTHLIRARITSVSSEFTGAEIMIGAVKPGQQSIEDFSVQQKNKLSILGRSVEEIYDLSKPCPFMA